MDDEELQRLMEEAADTSRTVSGEGVGQEQQQSMDLTPEMESMVSSVDRSGLEPTGVEAARSNGSADMFDGGSMNEIEVTDTDLSEQSSMPNPRAGNIQMNFDDFEGSKIEGGTPQGMPEPEEMSGFGEAITEFGNMMTKPGGIKFMGQMAQAFAGNRENEPGTILGQSAVSDAESMMEQELRRGLSEGKSIDEIDPGGTPSSETLNRATQSHQQQQQIDQGERRLEQGDRRLDQQGEQIEMSADEQEFQEWAQSEQIAQGWKRLGLQEDELDYERMIAQSEANEETRPADVQSFHHGAAVEGVAQQYKDIAVDYARSQDENVSLSDVQAMMSDDKNAFDPQAVFNMLPKNLRARAQADIAQASKMIARTSEGGQQVDPTAFEDAFQGMGVTSDPSELSDGDVFKAPNGKMYRRQGNSNIPINVPE